uniref:Putative 20.2 kDa salivary peptide n=1 Tax=Culex tarsalis TaxID=7177 RepID=A0A1Q3FU61_CULTA
MDHSSWMTLNLQKLIVIFCIINLLQVSHAETSEDEIEKLQKAYQESKEHYSKKLFEKLSKSNTEAVKIEMTPKLIHFLFEFTEEENDQKTLLNIFKIVDSNEEKVFQKFLEWFERDLRSGIQKILLAFACWATTGDTYSKLLSKPDNFRKYGALFSYAFSISKDGQKAKTEADKLNAKYCDLKIVRNHLESYTNIEMLEKHKIFYH